MSYAIIEVIYGVPLTPAASEKIDVWEKSGDERWNEDDGLCGFSIGYSADGDSRNGYCGVRLGELKTYTPEKVSDSAAVRLPTSKQKSEALRKVKALDPELRALVGDVDTYFIWSDS